MFDNIEKMVQFLIQEGVLKKSETCRVCNESMPLYFTKSRLNGIYFKCKNNKCK